METKLSFASDLITSCSVPELTADLDNIPIEPSHFDEYRKLLESQLPLLFDFIHHNDEWLCSKDDSETSLQIKSSLLMLISEITANKTPYKIHSMHYLDTLENFVQNRFCKVLNSATDVEEHIFNHYTQYLKADIWKRHIGKIHGFGQFLEVKALLGGRKFSTKWVNFALSVGLTVRECHLPIYKLLSTKIFQLIISSSDRREIKKANIPEVIFDSVFNSIRTVETVEETSAVWKCLCDCLDFNDDGDSWDWDMTDEMMESLLGSLKNSTDSFMTIFLLSFIPRILLRSTPNRKEIEKFLARNYDSLSAEDFQDFRVECSKISTCASYRWALYILKLFITESHKFLESPVICELMLQQFHVCYLTSIYIISIEIMNINLLKFFEQFSITLMEAIETHTQTPRVRELVRQIFATFIKHLEKSDLEDVTKDFQVYHRAFKKFIKEQ